MSEKTNPNAGLLAPVSELVDVSALLAAYETNVPNPENPTERVQFGTSGHRGSSLTASFNRSHLLAIVQAICEYRKSKAISGPLFLGIDTHALSRPALETTLEVLAGNGVTTRIAPLGQFTPTPVISHAILTYNQGRAAGLADGIVITPSHNPPRDGGIKYNAVHGGPAEAAITDGIERRANEILRAKLFGVVRVSLPEALRAATTAAYDFVTPYVRDLGNVIDFPTIRESGLRMGVDPLGGAGVHYWEPIQAQYGLDLTLVNSAVDPTFRFLPRDWDGQIRMDPSSPYAMKSVVERRGDFDIAFACDADHDRHGIVTPDQGLMPANDYLAVCADYLFRHRAEWGPNVQIGKTAVSTQMLDRVAARRGRKIYEVPVGFKWFVDGLHRGELGFAGEESAGASFLRKDGTVWTTDKDAFIPCLLAAEMTAKTGKSPTRLYGELRAALGTPISKRSEAPASLEQKAKFKTLTAKQIGSKLLAGEAIERISTQAPGNGASIGGIKVETKNGWFAARPSGTESIYKIYAESFRDPAHLDRLLREAQALVDETLA